MAARAEDVGLPGEFEADIARCLLVNIAEGGPLAFDEVVLLRERSGNGRGALVR